MEFTVYYDEQTMRNAVNTFIQRRIMGGLGKLGILALFMSCAALMFLLWEGDRSWVVGAVGAGLLLLVLIFVTLWQWRHAEMRRKLTAIPSRKGSVTLTNDSISIATEAGTTSLPWTTFSELWKLDDCWLLFLAPNSWIPLKTIHHPCHPPNYRRIWRMAGGGGCPEGSI